MCGTPARKTPHHDQDFHSILFGPWCAVRERTVVPMPMPVGAAVVGRKRWTKGMLSLALVRRTSTMVMVVRR